jgi:type VI secretion system protein ImpK
MTLLELCEPVFQYTCLLNRMGRAGTNADYTVVRAELKAMLEDLRQKANSDVRLANQYRQVELPLLFFIDSMIAESRLNFATQWHQNRLAYERNELAGDEKFFDLLEASMKDSSDDATDRLAIYYSCLGLGFTGMYVGQPEYLRKTMNTILPRIRHLVQRAESEKICPEAYEHVDTRKLTEPPAGRLVVVGVALLVLAAALAITYVWMFRDASGTFAESLRTISEKTAVRGK